MRRESAQDANTIQQNVSRKDIYSVRELSPAFSETQRFVTISQHLANGAVPGSSESSQHPHSPFLYDH
jgi:hypothetical protein